MATTRRRRGDQQGKGVEPAGAHHTSGEPGGTTGCGPLPLALVQPPEPSAARLAALLIGKAVGPAECSRPGEDGGVRVSEECRAAKASAETARSIDSNVTAGADQTSFDALCIVYVRSSTRRGCASSRRIAGA